MFALDEILYKKLTDKPELLSVCANLYGVSADEISQAMKDWAEKLIIKAKLESKGARIAEFAKEVEGFTVPSSIVRLLQRADALSTELSEKDNAVKVTLGFKKKDDGYVATISSTGISAAARGSLKTRYDYFIDGNKVNGRISKAILEKFGDSEAATAIRNKAKPTWTAIQEDGAIKGRVTRTPRS